MNHMVLGLRIDADTLRGTKIGVPNLCRLLNQEKVKASFFFSVGPDNMGRHIRRLIHPKFLIKMMRSKAASLYGWGILLCGNFGEGPIISDKCASEIFAVGQEGHEIGLHGWDHYSWQTHIDEMDQEAIVWSLKQGFEALTKLLGRAPVSSAAPAWKCNDIVLRAKSLFPFRYNSDSRGHSIFYPLVKGETILQLQIPVTLPTYDEVIGYGKVFLDSYNDYILSLLKPDKLNVLTIHAEAEGMSCLQMFEDFILKAKDRGVSIVPLGDLLNDFCVEDKSFIVPGSISGREGWGAFQNKDGNIL